jgi:hypothetical protein
MKRYTVYSFFPWRCTGAQITVSKNITDYDVEIIHVLLITDINYIAFIKYQVTKYGGLKYQNKLQGF